jgi:putative salt-induced outer membrane protein YdiY
LDARLGMDLIYGAKDRQIYYGQIALRYARPYRSNSRQFFRNTLEYRVDYATTDDVESANRMFGSDKMDFDVGERLFIYNFVGLGYDDVRKIDLQFEAGPGLGYHLLRLTNFTANVESGFSYQLQDRQDSQRIEAMYARIAQDTQWKIYEQISFSQRAALLTRVDAPDQMQLRLEANLGLAIVKNISFNLTAIEMYDTRPVPGVTPNEFQLRSAIGLAF